MNDDVKNEDSQESTESTEKEKPEKKKLAMPIIIGIVVVVLLLGGGGAYFFLQSNSAEAAEGEEEDVEEIVETNIYFSGFQTNVVNLAVSEDYEFMYLKYGFDIEVSDDAVIAEILEKLPRLTGGIAGIMSNRDWNEICTPQGRERMAREAIRDINDNLASGEVIGLYFTTFVAQ